MRYFIVLFAVAIMLTLVGCSNSSDSSSIPSNTQVYVPPSNYDEAVKQATHPISLGFPTGPSQCESVTVMGQPGMVVTYHNHDGTTTDYPVHADGYTAMFLCPPTVTLWFTVTTPAHGAVTWTGAQFTSLDGMSATWTSPMDASDKHPPVTIQVTVMDAPSGNG